MTDPGKKNVPVWRQLCPLLVFLFLIAAATALIANIDSFSAKEKKHDITEFNGMPLYITLRGKSHSAAREQKGSVSASSQDIPGIPGAEQAYLLATRDIEAGHLKEAEDRLRTAIVFHNRSEKLYSLLGSNLYSQGRYREAEEIFRKQAFLNPENHTAFNNLGAALAKQKKYPEAITAIRQVLKVNPDSVTAQLNLAGMYSMSGDVPHAMIYFRKVYDALGSRILPLSLDSNFNNIRDNKEFIAIIEEARKKYREEVLEFNSPAVPMRTVPQQPQQQLRGKGL